VQPYQPPASNTSMTTTPIRVRVRLDMTASLINAAMLGGRLDKRWRCPIPGTWAKSAHRETLDSPSTFPPV
jgi:hypothetical protein